MLNNLKILNLVGEYQIAFSDELIFEKIKMERKILNILKRKRKNINGVIFLYTVNYCYKKNK
jgi:hypothetical protein